jgi:hypothetical protein
VDVGTLLVPRPQIEMHPYRSHLTGVDFYAAATIGMFLGNCVAALKKYMLLACCRQTPACPLELIVNSLVTHPVTNNYFLPSTGHGAGQILNGL